MNDYNSIGLDSNMFNLTSPLVQRDFTTGFQFVTQNESGAITRAFMGSAIIGNAQLGTAIIGTAQVGTLSFNEISGGTINVLASLGTGNIKLDGANKRIVVNDGTVDRIYIGFQSGGF